MDWADELMDLHLALPQIVLRAQPPRDFDGFVLVYAKSDLEPLAGELRRRGVSLDRMRVFEWHGTHDELLANSLRFRNHARSALNEIRSEFNVIPLAPNLWAVEVPSSQKDLPVLRRLAPNVIVIHGEVVAPSLRDRTA